MKTRTANENKWLTQATLDNEEERIYTKSVSGDGEIEDAWVEADDEEKNTWEARYGNEEVKKAKAQKLQELEEYDNSTAVNEFFVNGKSCWLDKATRNSLRYRLEIAQNEKDAGNIETFMKLASLTFNGKSYVITDPGMALLLLRALEVYAAQCYDITAAHRRMIAGFKDVETVRNYKFEGYPEKLRFNL